LHDKDDRRMTEHKPKRPAFRLRRFDVAMLGTALLLGLVLLVLAETSNPKRLGITVAYLAPAYGGVQDVWLAPLNDPQNPIRLTNTRYGVYDFGVNDDGSKLVYAERSESGQHELILLNLQTRQHTPLTTCEAEGADCRTPRFRPSVGGQSVLAYERVTMATRLGMGENATQLGMGAIRIWLMDLTTRETRPLADDPQFIGHSPRWSLDGGSIAFYSADITNPGIMVYNFAPAEGQKSLKFVPSQYGAVGTLSPNGTQLIFPDLIRRSDGQIYAYLRLADLQGLQYVNFSAPEDPIDDTAAEWHPNGQSVVVERRYTDDRYTRGYQLYSVDVATSAVTPLIVDDAYNHGFFAFNSTGSHLLLQRFPFAPPEGGNTTPQVWVYDMATGALSLIADNAFHPRWVVGVGE
jgi:dipeptidyl aminopeptidase/acylaminoacyl peptidase